MEREIRQYTTEDLLAMWFMAKVHGGHFYGQFELGKRLAVASMVSVVLMSNMLVEGSAKAGKTVVGEFTS